MRTTLTYVGLRVQDMERALRFYEALGLRLQRRDKIQETGGEVAYVATAGRQSEDQDARAPRVATHEGGPRLELNWYPPRSPHAVPYMAGEALDHLGVAVDGDVRAVVESLVAAGGTLRHEGPIEGLVYVDSPDGHTVELWKS